MWSVTDAIFRATMLMSAVAFIPVAAQDPTINSRHTSPVTRDMRYREWSLKDLEKNAGRTPAEQKLAWAQIREDFKNIQVLSNDLAQHRTAVPVLDVKFVEKVAAAIHQRAARLQANLMLPKKEGAPVAKVQADYQMSTLLSGLSGLIRRFINNPIFGEATVLDLQAATGAQSDLDRIIELSEQLKKRAQSAK